MCLVNTLSFKINPNFFEKEKISYLKWYLLQTHFFKHAVCKIKLEKLKKSFVIDF